LNTHVLHNWIQPNHKKYSTIKEVESTSLPRS
jgi:hypothetical protein